MEKIISITLLENTATHYIAELTIEVKKIFSPNTTRVIKVFKKKSYSMWRNFNTGDWIGGSISESLNAFISTGKESITF